MKTKLPILIASLICSCSTVFALVAGDVGFLTASADGNDEFSWVALADITAGTTIYFADNAYNETSLFNTNEGTIAWSHTSDVAAGTVITKTGVTAWSMGSFTTPESGFAVGAGGENLIAYLGTDVSTPTTFLGAIGWGGTAWITSGSPATTNSYLPGEIASYAITLTGTSDNVAYSGGDLSPTTKAGWWSRMQSTGDWTGNDATALTWGGGNLSVTPVPEPSTYALIFGGLVFAVVAWQRRKTR